MTAGRHIPFDIKRVFYIYGNEYERGGHAHKKCEQVLIAIFGYISVWIGAFEYRLGTDIPKNSGLYVPTNYRIKMNFDPHSILLVLASEDYDPDDYI
jgi:hypothetical protein